MGSSALEARLSGDGLRMQSVRKRNNEGARVTVTLSTPT